MRHWLRRWWNRRRWQRSAGLYPPRPKRRAQPAGGEGEEHHGVHVFGRPRSRFPREVKVILFILLLGALLVLICPRMSRDTTSGRPLPPLSTQQSGG